VINTTDSGRAENIDGIYTWNKQAFTKLEREMGFGSIGLAVKTRDKSWVRVGIVGICRGWVEGRWRPWTKRWVPRNGMPGLMEYPQSRKSAGCDEEKNQQMGSQLMVGD